jgi:hypothetical protein
VDDPGAARAVGGRTRGQPAAMAAIRQNLDAEIPDFLGER